MSAVARCLRLYAPAIVLVLLAGMVQLVPDSPGWIAVRLLLLAASLAISIREQRRHRHERQR